MHMIRVITIDDERRSRMVLAELLSFIPEVEIIFEAGNVDDAVREIRDQKPDLIFLDIEMPIKSGFDLLMEIKADSHIPDIIFVTAYDRYAIEAFKYTAFDYLLKPINRSELQNSLNRYRETKSKEKINDKLGELFRFMEEPKKLVFDLRTGLLIIDPEELVYCEADGKYPKFRISPAKLTELKELFI